MGKSRTSSIGQCVVVVCLWVMVIVFWVAKVVKLGLLVKKPKMHFDVYVLSRSKKINGVWAKISKHNRRESPVSHNNPCFAAQILHP